MMRRISVLFWKSYSRLKWIWPTFSLGSELSIYMSTREMDLLCRNAFCNITISALYTIVTLALFPEKSINLEILFLFFRAQKENAIEI